MSIFFERFISRASRARLLPGAGPGQGLRLPDSQMHAARARATSSRYTLLEVLPAVVYNLTARAGRGQPAAQRIRGDARHLTGKLGLTSKLVLDADLEPRFQPGRGRRRPGRRQPALATSTSPRSGRSSWRAARSSSWPGLGPARSRPRSTPGRIVDPLLGFKLSGKVGDQRHPGRHLRPRRVAVGRSPASRLGGGPDAGFAIFRYKRALSGDGYLGAFYTGREQGGGFNQRGRRWTGSSG
ncbi:MAG: hypothetical protein MZV64_43995 [Ignavibacteriales bacterium]|nr:hypothetical protein [Ignavibacteriales bacterium]